jgi:transferase CAF17, mitochondrial
MLSSLSTQHQTIPALAPNLDIRPVVVQEPGSEGRRPRPRGTGKLLTTSEQGVGLALLRLEQVEGAEKGDLRLEFDASGGEGKDTWIAAHWWPDWWPHSEAEQ